MTRAETWWRSWHELKWRELTVIDWAQRGVRYICSTLMITYMTTMNREH